MDLASEDFAGSAPLPVTFGYDETHDENLLPRMWVGLLTCADFSDKCFVVVGGRNLNRALGLTLSNHKITGYFGCWAITGTQN